MKGGAACQRTMRREPLLAMHGVHQPFARACPLFAGLIEIVEVSSPSNGLTDHCRKTDGTALRLAITVDIRSLGR